MLVYIHVPFCASKCGYCAFFSVTEHAQVDAYTDALVFEITNGYKDFGIYGADSKNTSADSKTAHADSKITSIFIGGGTPNVVNIKHYERIFDALHARFNIESSAEITMEANPNLLSADYAKAIAKLGVNRLSVGVQSFNADKLRFLERDHVDYDFSKIAKVFEAALSAGIARLSIDLIYDTPLDSVALLESEITSAAKLPVEHISAYSLSIDPGSAFARRGVNLPIESLCYEVREMLSAQGFFQYEVSNYARADSAICGHNVGYWQGKEYLGFGASSVARVGFERLMSVSNVAAYIKNPLKKCAEKLSQSDLDLEKIMLGLRTKFGVDERLLAQKNVENLLAWKKIIKKDSKILPQELFLSDEIALWLLKN